jgi:hypothetical protein
MTARAKQLQPVDDSVIAGILCDHPAPKRRSKISRLPGQLTMDGLLAEASAGRLADFCRQLEGRAANCDFDLKHSKTPAFEKPQLLAIAATLREIAAELRALK